MTACLLVCVSAANTRAQTVDVYIQTGQSNSLGTTGLEGGAPHNEPGSDPADAGTQFFWSNVSAANTGYPPVLYGDSAGTISTLQMQQGDGGVNPFFWGPEFGFARTMADNVSGNDILIIKASRGGGGNSFWDQATFNSNNNAGHMWGHVKDQVDIALGLLNSAGVPFEVKGLIYMQGESNNAGQASIADTRIKQLAENLQAHIETAYGATVADFYTVIIEIAASETSTSRSTTTDLQRSLAHRNSEFAFVTTSDQPLKSDGIHFGSEAKLIYGSRVADAFNSRDWRENENVIGGYNADANLNAPVPDPAGLGFDLRGRDVDVIVEEVHDSGSRAWRIYDDSPGSNPGYFQSLYPVDFQRMFNSDWEFSVTAGVVDGGGEVLWSVAAENDPGWGIGANGIMNGFQLDRVNGDELRVSLWQNQLSFDLGSGSADAFHTIKMAGHAGSSIYDLYIDGNPVASSLDLLNGTGSTAAQFQNVLLFNSGSMAGTGRDVYWKEVRLTAEPADGLPEKLRSAETPPEQRRESAHGPDRVSKWRSYCSPIRKLASRIRIAIALL